ncbi:hypothetical protein HYH03_014038 [Edaphochlamys debaryana]|uniref:Cytochrome b5 heme-binding domain-containing protein n=1 Tax=Edaphochlamys debaryana TaxID=47281 RepID=A0A835XNV0_9CHLO|nr:hypothetical protein HYH03_014038 [Edaphochlamys debaryana]|eukprot:KAG2487321.1 hypothetical protein HYH03_014038 [Edaphochlamys debaryana]
MVLLQSVSRAKRPGWLLPALSLALQQNAGGAQQLSGERGLSTATAMREQQSGKRVASLLGAGAALLASASLLWPDRAEAKKELGILPGSKPAQPAPSSAPVKPAAPEPAAKSAGLGKDDKGRPIYSSEEVAKHKTLKDRVWVTFKDGVYDITEFVEMHPGGASKILMAAGGSVEPFWALYQQHRKAEVLNILEPYRIGTLEGGAAAAAAAAAAAKDPYASDPARHPALIARSMRPYNGETPGSLLAAAPITPNDIFFTRNHLPVPHLDAEAFRLRVEGEGTRALEFSLEELKTRFRKHSVTATVQCTGNRRNEMSAVKPVKGLEWDQGAIGTAVWSGVRLRDVLRALGSRGLGSRVWRPPAPALTLCCSPVPRLPAAMRLLALRAAGLSEEDPLVKHIIFEGADKDATTGDVYGASIPVSKALAADGDVLLAYEMNGQPLSKDHGFPLRVIVPGVTGARSVKWLNRIVASQYESGSHWQQRDYKSFCPSVDWDSVEWGSAPAIQEPPVTSAITEPAPGTPLSAADGEITIRGYAWSGGGRGIVRVDVSTDGGRSWAPARLLPPPPGAPPPGSYSGAWAWTLWETTVPLPKPSADGSLPPAVELVCKAVDASYNSQPDGVAGIWNLRGVVNNAWHRVKLDLEP